LGKEFVLSNPIFLAQLVVVDEEGVYVLLLSIWVLVGGEKCEGDEVLEYWSIYCWEKSQYWRGKDVQLKCLIMGYC